MTDKAEDDHLKSIFAGIYEHISKCEKDRITGELVIKIPFSQGGIGQVKVECKKILRLK